MYRDAAYSRRPLEQGLRAIRGLCRFLLAAVQLQRWRPEIQTDPKISVEEAHPEHAVDAQHANPFHADGEKPKSLDLSAYGRTEDTEGVQRVDTELLVAEALAAHQG